MFEAMGAAGKVVRTIVGLKDTAEILEAIIPLQEIINDAQREATEALTRIHDLTTENHSLKQQLNQQEDLQAWRAKYKFQTAEIGTQVLVLKDGHNTEDNYQYICANCYERGDKGMQVRREVLYCNRCRANIGFRHPKRPSLSRSTSKM